MVRLRTPGGTPPRAAVRSIHPSPSGRQSRYRGSLPQEMRMHLRILPYGMALLLLPAAALTLHGQVKNEEYVRAAVQGAPERISGQAAVVRIEPGGKTSTLRKGSNGFTCALFPDASLAPVCANEQGWAWLTAALSNKPKPPNTRPGIAYMAKGGV